MKAIVQHTYGSPDVLQLQEIDSPRVGPEDVLIRVHAAGVDPGVWHLMTGLPYLVRLAVGVRRPRNPVRGLDVAGVVEAVGTKVTAFKPGDEVFGVGDGSFAEYACASQDRVHPKPANLSFEHAAAVPISATTALQGLRAANLQPGQKVLIIGAGGGVGSFAVQLARAMGAEVTGVCSTSKVEWVRSMGAHHVIDYTREGLAGGPYDVILDTAGNRELPALRRVLASRGTVVLIGGEGGGRWFGGLGRQLWAMAVAAFSSQKFRSIFALVNKADLAVLKERIEAGALTPVVDRSYALSEVPAAIRSLAEGHSRGKVVIKVV
ncbi:NADPH:quinone reductase-like Zn-dependent oxidoreductase [Archangium gephyra]|uniref:NADPH:quinone reductase-like Zn-dependent oxidoreductase n=1 Tax=Archangium gephyra TaxID=48 RepID=A0AAC8QFE1_9BACT|nr:NAD(P)-dependent alcohol dehydrogenase [Archangium gephyra]AKJ06126.1 zinc-containing alcohol dehydrogenase [Archangium gephyra]REG27120.1 NADPH:quinone reductase-like Zn-dependent oxidoreductase [Archangium gephyra]